MMQLVIAIWEMKNAPVEREEILMNRIDVDELKEKAENHDGLLKEMVQLRQEFDELTAKLQILQGNTFESRKQV
jgi:hemerythrin